MASARAFGSAGSTTKPTPFFTISATPPTLVATTGTPDDRDSKIVMGKPSETLGRTIKSADGIISSTSLRAPKKTTPGIPLASCSSSPFKGPSPTIKSSASTSSCFLAFRRYLTPFWLTRLPTNSRVGLLPLTATSGGSWFWGLNFSTSTALGVK